MFGLAETSVLFRGGDDRRTSDRFPIERDMRYKVINKEAAAVAEGGSGKTVNISRRGVLFTTDDPPLLGRRVQASISWPYLLDGTCRLKLVAEGRVIRRAGRQVALKIDKYQLHTVGSGSLVAQAAS